MKHPLLHNIMVRVIPVLMAGLIRLWFSTCRVREHGREYRRQLEAEGRSVIATFWHYSIVYFFYHIRDVSAAVLVSASKDGEYIARLAQNLGYETVRGSRNQRGFRALKELIVHLKNGHHVGIVADGSQGPAHVVQSGCIMMSSKTGSPILPMVWSASSCIVFNSWDRTAIPKPFSRVEFFYGKSFIVPPDLNSEQIEQYRQKLESEMNDLYRQAWQIFNREHH